MEVILFQLGKVLFEERKRMLLFKIQISFLNIIIIIIWSALLSLYYINRLVCFAGCRTSYMVSDISVRQSVTLAHSLRN